MYFYTDSTSISLRKNKKRTKIQIQPTTPFNTSYINYIHKSLNGRQGPQSSLIMTDNHQAQAQPPTSNEEDQRQREALAAFTATLHSVGTNLEAPLRDRAANINANAGALQKQEDDLAESTARLARQNEQWVGLADETRNGLKEIGDVQNWAELIQRDLFMLEEMMDGIDARDMAEVVEGDGDRDRDGEASDGGLVGDGLTNGDLDGGKKADGGDAGRQGGWLRWW